jgi:DNA-binding transcriptional regulator YiaG
MSEIQALRKEMNMTQQEFADYFGFNLRTLQNWEIERVKPPIYLVGLLQRILKAETIKKD